MASHPKSKHAAIDALRRIHAKTYSQHFHPAGGEGRGTSTTGHDAPSDAVVDELPRDRPKAWRNGILGLSLLGCLIWGVAQLGYLPPMVEAQEQQEEAAPANPSPWKAASFPVESFQAYTSPFGYRQHPFGGVSFHYGLDIAAPMGSYVRSWWEGTVVEVSDDTACGTSVVVESHDWLHIYCHMQGYVVVEKDGDRWLVDPGGGIQIRQGDVVPTGKRIGRVGMTGRTTGPHLHWGIKYQGSWIDPAVVVKAMNE